MSETDPVGFLVERPWDARFARWLVAPLNRTWVTPNHLTTLRLAVGVAASAAFLPGTYGWSNMGALLLVLSNFLDHTDGELARISGKTSRFGHAYDLASDALVTVLLFIAIGVGAGGRSGSTLEFPLLGMIAGTAVASIFYLRMRIEALAGKAATRQAALIGFETEDILYLMPLVALCKGLPPMLVLSAIIAPLYALWTVSEFRRVAQQLPPLDTHEVAR